MIVSAWSTLPLTVNKNTIKKHLINAIEYAALEGGRIFLSESGTEFSELLGEVIDEYNFKVKDLIHMPVEYSDEILSKIDKTMSNSRRPSDRLRQYITEKADIVIILESRESIAIRGLPKTTLRIKI